MPAQSKHKASYIHTRDRILDAAEHLIATKGVYGFNLKDIAGPVGIRVPSIYKHFKNKDEVLIGVSRRFINLLSMQYQDDSRLSANESLHQTLARFVTFNVDHPAFVRLALIDFATPKGGMEYVTLAAGGDFRENLQSGPLADMHRRLKFLLDRGFQAGVFRQVDDLDFYSTIYASLLLKLVFPDDAILVNSASADVSTMLSKFVIELSDRFLQP